MSIGSPSHEDCTHALDNIRPFSELPDEARQHLMASSTCRTYAAGSIIARTGDPIRSVIIVVTGKLKTFRTDAEGEEYLLDVLHDGEAIWHAIFREDHLYHCTVAALSKVTICLVPRDAFYALLNKHPAMAIELIHIIGGKLAEAEDRIMTLGIRSPRRRLAGYLLNRDERCIGPNINLRLDDIASSVGLRPETVSRTISAFERDGLVSRPGRGKVRVIDREGLSEIADGA